MGFHCLETDWAIWIKNDAYIAYHIDDMIVSRNRDFVDRTFIELGKRNKTTKSRCTVKLSWDEDTTRPH